MSPPFPTTDANRRNGEGSEEHPAFARIQGQGHGMIWIVPPCGMTNHRFFQAQWCTRSQWPQICAGVPDRSKRPWGDSDSLPRRAGTTVQRSGPVSAYYGSAPGGRKPPPVGEPGPDRPSGELAGRPGEVSTGPERSCRKAGFRPGFPVPDFLVRATSTSYFDGGLSWPDIQERPAGCAGART